LGFNGEFIMPKHSEFVDYLLESLASFGFVTAKSMFGGYGIYRGELMFALVADDVLYLKVDDHNRAQFEACGSQPFVYEKQGKPLAMSYYQLPEEALDNSVELCRWAELAYQAALRAAAAKSKGKKAQ
jgi:DNA transformation protein